MATFLKRVFLLIIFASMAGGVSSQNGGAKNENALSFKVRLAQTKEAMNYGLVYNGIELAFEYSTLRYSENHLFRLSTGLDIGLSKGMGMGLNWYVNPVNAWYGFRISHGRNLDIYLGPYFDACYRWQLYPELQSGHMAWLTSYEVGASFMISFPLGSRRIYLTNSNSLAAFVSRPETGPEEYFYSLGFRDFAVNSHTNMKFGSCNLLCHYTLRIELVKPGRSNSIFYEFEGTGYYDSPAYSYRSHSINLKLTFGKNKKS